MSFSAISFSLIIDADAVLIAQPFPSNLMSAIFPCSTLAVSRMSLADAGNYQVVVSNAFGLATSAVAQVVFHCVDAAGRAPTPPYLTWDTAATNIQDAIDAAAAGEFVLVTNGVYVAGGKVMAEDLTNRVALSKAVEVVSVNGYAVTVIQGMGATPTNGLSAVRCAWLTTNAILSGFTLTNGQSTDFYRAGGSPTAPATWRSIVFTQSTGEVSVRP